MAIGGRGIKSISVAGRILRVMVERGQPIMLSEIAEEAEINASQAHTYLTSFRRTGLVEQDTDLGRYSIGPTALQLAVGHLRSSVWQRQAMQAVGDLSAEFGVMALLIAWGTQGPTVVQIREGLSNMNLNMRIGTVLSVTGTASGRIFSAFGSSDVIQKSIDAELDQARGEHQGRGSDYATRFNEAIDQIRTSGVAWAAGSPIPNVNAVCVPIFGPEDSLFFSVSLVDFADRLPVEVESPAVSKLRTVAAEISTLAREGKIAS